tara:strand:+ start:208 stop:519 length:312 start_codon:yes stop_codon:yes gene_type:complete
MTTLQDTTNKNRTSDSYVDTVNHHTWEGKKLVAAYRAKVKAEDKLNGTSRRVMLQGRMGVANPNAHKYSVKNPPNVWSGSHSHQCIKLSDAATADVYIYDRYR